MDIHETSLLATCKTTAAFGAKYAADYPPTSMGGKQFAIIAAAVPQEGTLGAQQVSGGAQKKAGVKSKAVAYKQLHDDMLAISDAAHSLVLVGTTGLDGKFHMPRNHGAQDVLNAARAFQADATPFTAQFTSVGLPADFLTTLDGHTTDYETAISATGAGAGTQASATGGIKDTNHKAAIALHVLNTIVTNTYKNDPPRLAEWVVASHVQKHTPVPRAKPAAAAAK